MSSIFRKDDNYVDKPKRNTFDLSRQNNVTLKYGYGIPIMCQEVLPGDSFKIDPTFALRFLPQVFPVQTRQRASIKFYYVRNRNLWDDWMDFIGKTKSDLTPPYVDFSDLGNVSLKPSSLCDYMGVPVKVGHTDKTLRIAYPYRFGNGDYVYVPSSSIDLLNNVKDTGSILMRKNIDVLFSLPSDYSQNEGSTTQCYLLTDYYGGVYDSAIPSPIISKFDNYATRPKYTIRDFDLKMFRIPIRPLSFVSGPKVTDNCIIIARTKDGRDVFFPLGSSNYTLPRSVKLRYLDETDLTQETYLEEQVDIEYVLGYMSFRVGGDSRFPSTSIFDLKVQTISNPDLYWCDIDLRDVPYYSSQNPDGYRISALPFRAYEAVYNALVRNAENNPFKINGVPEYNKFNAVTRGGAQSHYGLTNKLFNVNWSDDRFTTALPSPQQGNAPLVGLTGTTGATVTLGNEDGSQSVVHLQVDSDTGNVVMVDGVSGGSNNPSMTHAFMSAVDYGITINDLRNVNSFQKWLENNIRRGYKYKDQLLSHYGVNARYDVLDMPEFLGGVTRDVSVQQITQQVENEFGNLGDYAGQSSVFGEGRAIEHYCDEHGFILGILDVKPMPLYSDAMPKHLLKSDPFDYYFPEFSKIGMQPITKKELSFSQSYNEEKSDEVFGYQRPWYDYLENLDEVHGLFRSDFRNFIMARDFLDTPELGSDFLTVDYEDINNTFYVQDDKDKILGNVYLKVIAKRPIPIVGIPAIE